MNINDLYKIDLVLKQVQNDISNTVKSKVDKDLISTRDIIDGIPQFSSISDSVMSKLIFVKWIRKSGESIHHSEFKSDTKYDIISVTYFDSSYKSNSNGIHLISVDCAFEYIIQEGLPPGLSFHDLSLLVCSIPEGIEVIRHSFCLYSKVRVQSIKRHCIIPLNYTRNWINEIKIDRKLLDGDEMFILNYLVSNDTSIWRLSYFLNKSRSVNDIIEKYRKILQIIKDTFCQKYLCSRIIIH